MAADGIRAAGFLEVVKRFLVEKWQRVAVRDGAWRRVAEVPEELGFSLKKQCYRCADGHKCDAS